MQLGVTPLISEANRTLLHSPHVLLQGSSNKEKPRNIGEVWVSSYCLAWIRQGLSPSPLFWHKGGTSGCKTVVGFCPDSGMGIVVLSNYSRTELPEALMYRYYDYSEAFLKGHTAPPPAPAQAGPPGGASGRLCGTISPSGLWSGHGPAGGPEPAGLDRQEHTSRSGALGRGHLLLLRTRRPRFRR